MSCVYGTENSKCDIRYAIYTIPRLIPVTNWVRLKFAAIKLKKFAIHRWNRSDIPAFYPAFFILFLF